MAIVLACSIVKYGRFLKRLAICIGLALLFVPETSYGLIFNELILNLVLLVLAYEVIAIVLNTIIINSISKKFGIHRDVIAEGIFLHKIRVGKYTTKEEFSQQLHSQRAKKNILQAFK